MLLTGSGADARVIIHATRKLAARLPDVSPEPLREDCPLGGWHADRLIFDRRQCLLFTATLATLGCSDDQIARAELALGPVRYQLEAHIWDAPHVLDADPLVLSCRLTDRPATVGGKTIWPRDRLLDLVAQLGAQRH